jgi:hypothetical protein
MQFKTLEEQQAALDSISTDPADAPVNMKLDQWETETEAKIDEIMQAEITDTAQPEPDDEQARLIPPEERAPEPVQPQNIEQPVPPVESQAPSNPENEQLKRNNDYLRQQLNSQARQISERDKKFQEQIDALKNQNREETPAKKPGPKSETEHQMIAIRDEIKQLEEEMNNEENDYDTELNIKNLKKHSTLQLKLSALREQRQEELIRKQNNEINKLKNEHRLKKEKLDEDEAEDKRNRALEDFRKEIPELSGTVPFAQMETEYNSFAREVAAAYYSISPGDVQDNHAEVAMAAYLEGSPILNETLSSRGISEPSELRKFVVLSEIDGLRQGYVLDKLTGEFVEMKDPMGNKVTFPNHKSAYLYLQQENGEYGKKILSNVQKTQKNMMHAMTRREPVELTSNLQRGELDNMTTERAMEILEKYDTDFMAMRGRKNFRDPLFVEYNRALSKLGHATIDEDDL